MCHHSEKEITEASSFSGNDVGKGMYPKAMNVCLLFPIPCQDKASLCYRV